jgi:hypothetical protein
MGAEGGDMAECTVAVRASGGSEGDAYHAGSNGTEAVGAEEVSVSRNVAVTVAAHGALAVGVSRLQRCGLMRTRWGGVGEDNPRKRR